MSLQIDTTQLRPAKPWPTEMQVARIRAQKVYPFLSDWLFSVSLIVSEQVALPRGEGKPPQPTMACDAYGRVYVHPSLLTGDDAWDRDVLGGVLLHEIGHLVRDHAKRGAKAVWQGVRVHPTVYNIAADGEMNTGLERDGAKLPDWGVFPGRMAPDGGETLLSDAVPGLLAEQYVDHIMKKLQQQVQQGGATGDSDDPNAVPVPMPGGSGGGASCPKGEGASGGECGSGGGGEKQPWELDAPGQGSSDGESDSSDSEPGGSSEQGRQSLRDQLKSQQDPTGGMSEQEMDTLRRVTAGKVQQWAKGRGHGAGSWSMWADSVLEEPPVSPEELLRDALNQAREWASGRGDFTFGRMPHRRRVVGGGGIVPPGVVRPVPRVILMVDTSGSMGGDGPQVLGWVDAFCRESATPVEIFCVDYDVKSTGMQNVSDVSDVQWTGGGGTDMRVGFQYLMKTGNIPDVLVVVTDGYTPWPAREPGFRTVIALTQDSGSHYKPPSWADVVECKEKV